MRGIAASLVLSLAFLALLEPADAQSCPGATATLTISPNTCVQPGNTVSMQLLGSPNAMVMVMVSGTTGMMQIPGHSLMFSTFTLCLQNPMMFTMGWTDGTGTFQQSFPVPSGVPSGSTLHLQGLLMTMNAGGGTGHHGGHTGGHTGGGGMQMQMQVQTSNLDSICFI